MELIFFFFLDSGKKFLNCSRPLFACQSSLQFRKSSFYWAPWHLLVSLFTKSSNNYREEGAIAFPKVGSFSINFLLPSSEKIGSL